MVCVIGLISGTSVDGIDAALVDIAGTEWELKVEFLAGATYPYPASLREQILALCSGAAISMGELAELDDAIALAFAQAAQNIQSGHSPAQLIGSHGQTVYHRPLVKDGEMGRWGDGKMGGGRDQSHFPYSALPSGHSSTPVWAQQHSRLGTAALPWLTASNSDEAL